MIRERALVLLGITLVLFGALLLLESAGFPVVVGLWKVWPLVLVLAGVRRLARTRNGRDPRLPVPERALLGLLTVAGLLTTLLVRASSHDHWGRERDDTSWARPLPPIPPLPLLELTNETISLPPLAPLSLEVDGADLEVTVGPPGMLTAVLSGTAPGRPENHGLLRPELDGERRIVHFSGAGGRTGGRMSLRVVLPVDSPTTIRHSAGALRATGLGALEIRGDSSEIVVEDIPGAVTIEAINGSVRVEDVVGPVAITATFAHVLVGSVAGRVRIESSYANVTAESLQSDLEIRANDGSVSAQQIEGETTIHAPRSTISLSRVRDIKVETWEGAVHADLVRGNATIVARTSEIKLARVQGNANIMSSLQNASVDRVEGRLEARIEDADLAVEDCQGVMDIGSLRGHVRIKRTGGPGRIEAVDGDLWLELGRAAADESAGLELVSDRGDVTLVMHRRGAQLEVLAEPGRIVERTRSPLQVTTSGPVARLTGSVREGMQPVRIITRHGTVWLEE